MVGVQLQGFMMRIDSEIIPACWPRQQKEHPCLIGFCYTAASAHILMSASVPTIISRIQIFSSTPMGSGPWKGLSLFKFQTFTITSSWSKTPWVGFGSRKWFSTTWQIVSLFDHCRKIKKLWADNGGTGCQWMTGKTSNTGCQANFICLPVNLLNRHVMGHWRPLRVYVSFWSSMAHWLSL